MEFSKWELEFFEMFDAFAKSCKNYAEAAEKLHLSTGTFNSYKYRKRHPSHARVEAITRMIRGSGSPCIKRVGVNSPTEAVLGNGLPRIPVVLAAGAGSPIEFWDASSCSTIEVLPGYWRNDLRGVVINGDSMAPTIKPGSICGVIPVQGDLNEGGIYLIHRPPFGYQVKRVRTNAEGEIILESDNPQYPPQVVPFEGYADIIIGQVCWVMQMV